MCTLIYISAMGAYKLSTKVAVTNLLMASFGKYFEHLVRIKNVFALNSLYEGFSRPPPYNFFNKINISYNHCNVIYKAETLLFKYCFTRITKKGHCASKTGCFPLFSKLVHYYISLIVFW